MTYLRVMALVLITTSTSATAAQVKDQFLIKLECAAVAQGVAPVLESVREGEKLMTGLEWAPLILHTSGQLTATMTVAGAAQANLVKAFVAYKASLEGVIRTARLCAR